MCSFIEDFPALKLSSVLWHVTNVSGGSCNTSASTRAPEELTLLKPKTIVEEVEVSDNDVQGHDHGGLDNHAGHDHCLNKSENYPHVEICNESKIWPNWSIFLDFDATACVNRSFFVKSGTFGGYHSSSYLRLDHHSTLAIQGVPAKNSLNWEI